MGCGFNFIISMLQRGKFKLRLGKYGLEQEERGKEWVIKLSLLNLDFIPCNIFFFQFYNSSQISKFFKKKSSLFL